MLSCIHVCISFLGLLTNCHRLDVLKTAEMYYYLTVLKARVSQGVYRAMIPVKVPGKTPFPLPGNPWHSLACTCVTSILPSPSHGLFPYILSVCLNVFPYKDTSHWIIGPTLTHYNITLT